ncbi:type VI secretion system ImpA family N-terminal domain-containing protein [Citrobacter sp. ku-bf4]|uniref:VasL domain-containing protein n=1 Tax=Citrobacter TaxID=544 RepID=UPI0019823617|nr:MULTISPECIES: VasL domain-containing protein [Citrobacter]MBN6042544.1 type VI secretion system ImpA family N-terminal domain-containing protein [Citrobacter sp. ku-bf4]MBS0823920.1 type VI secretion system ImpA family N-terminal domain-containing protein [Citrobacter amalonaticus]
MITQSERHLRTGGDPRALADYTLLRDELNKLTHPARPDVNWPQVENRALALFEHNGVELQTASWYTLARTHIASIDGLNEGLAILNALVAHQWAVMWPPQTHARVEILSGLSQRLQKVFRTLTLAHHNLPALYQGEKLLTTLNDALGRRELKQSCQLEGLRRQLFQAVTRLENSTPQEDITSSLTLPPQALVAAPPVSESRLVYVVLPEPEVRVDVMHAPPPAVAKWPLFTSGMLTAFVISALSVWGWQIVHQEDDTRRALRASVAALPAPLIAEQMLVLKQSGSLAEGEAWLKQASAQLDSVAALPPDWHLHYGGQIIAQAQTLWPDEPQVRQMQSRWRQLMAENTLPESSLTGWHQGMERLQALTDKLNALDKQKGKYITVSELKSTVYEMMNLFRQTEPLEEQLYLLRHSENTPQRQQQIRQAEQHLRAQIYTLMQENNATGSAGQEPQDLKDAR